MLIANEIYSIVGLVNVAEATGDISKISAATMLYSSNIRTPYVVVVLSLSVFRSFVGPLLTCAQVSANDYRGRDS